MEKGRKTNKIFSAEKLEFFQLCRSDASDRFLAFSWQQFTYHTCDNCARNSDPFHCRICNWTWYA